MWQALAMAGVKSLLDEQNRKKDIASNVITQRYSPWTGARADFSAQGQNKSGSNMLQGLAAGLMDTKEAEEVKDIAPVTDAAGGATQASTAYLTMPERRAAAKSAFSPPSRAPATQVAPTQSSFQGMFQPQDQTPLMLQGPSPQSQENMWLKMMNGGGFR